MTLPVPDADVVTIDAPMMTDALVTPPPTDAPTDAKVCPPAPSNCRLFKCDGSTSCYYECGSRSSTTGRQTWSGARTSCTASALGCIVTINSQAEQDCVATQTDPVFPDNVWIGLRQSSGGSEPAGGWGWECPPSSYTYPAWGGSEPNNQGGNEDCGILATGGGWNDGNCTTVARYVCELP